MVESRILPAWIPVKKGYKDKETGISIEPYEYFSVGYFVTLDEEFIEKARVIYSVAFTVELRYWNSDCKSVAVKDKTGEIEIKQFFILPIEKERQEFYLGQIEFLESRFAEAETADEKMAIREEIDKLIKRAEDLYGIDLDEWAKIVTEQEAQAVWDEYREKKVYGGLVSCKDDWTINIIRKNVEKVT